MEQNEFNRRVNQDIQSMMGASNWDDHMLLEGNNMICKHCNTKQQLKMPTTFDDMDETFTKFMDLHTHCEKTASTNTRKPITGVDEIAKQALTNAVNDGYHAGFDHGCDYILNEAEYWVREGKGTLADFVVYLKDFKKG
jgi:hypothetical protein